MKKKRCPFRKQKRSKRKNGAFSKGKRIKRKNGSLSEKQKEINGKLEKETQEKMDAISKKEWKK